LIVTTSPRSVVAAKGAPGAGHNPASVAINASTTIGGIIHLSAFAYLISFSPSRSRILGALAVASCSCSATAVRPAFYCKADALKTDYMAV
jgi:hypothetical protein